MSQPSKPNPANRINEQAGFIAAGKEIQSQDLVNAYNDLKAARTMRGWSTPSWAAPVQDTKITPQAINELRTIASYNNQGPRYLNTFPGYTATSGESGNKIRRNFLNEIRLTINDTKNMLGCASGCAGACYASCAGTCDNTCTGTCSNGCSGACSNSCSERCDGVCKSACGTTCSSASCYNSCGGVCVSCGSSCSANTCSQTCGSSCSSRCDGECGSKCTGSCGSSSTY